MSYSDYFEYTLRQIFDKYTEYAEEMSKIWNFERCDNDCCNRVYIEIGDYDTRISSNLFEFETDISIVTLMDDETLKEIYEEERQQADEFYSRDNERKLISLKNQIKQLEEEASRLENRRII